VKIQIELFLLLIASLNAESEKTLASHADRIIALVHEDVGVCTAEDWNAVPVAKRRELLERLVNTVEVTKRSANTFIS